MDNILKSEDKLGRRVESFIIGQMMDLEEDGFKLEDPIFKPSKTALDAAVNSAWAKYSELDQMTFAELNSMIICLDFVVKLANDDDFNPQVLDGLIWQLEQLQMLKKIKCKSNPFH